MPFHKDLDVNYSIMKCASCGMKHIARKDASGERVEELTPVHKFSLKKSSDFLSRYKILYPKYTHLTYGFAMEMVNLNV